MYTISVITQLSIVINGFRFQIFIGISQAIRITWIFFSKYSFFPDADFEIIVPKKRIFQDVRDELSELKKQMCTQVCVTFPIQEQRPGRLAPLTQGKPPATGHGRQTTTIVKAHSLL